MHISYMRVSTTAQDKKNDLELQKTNIQITLEREGIEKLDKEFIDVDSGLKSDRKDFKRMKTFLANNPGSTLWVTEQNRLVREPADLDPLKAVIIASGTIIRGIYETIDFRSEAGEDAADLKVALSKIEARKIKNRLRRGQIKKIAELKAQGKNWGPPPKIKKKAFDYYYIEKKITDVKDLVLIFGVSRKTIYKYLHLWDYEVADMPKQLIGKNKKSKGRPKKLKEVN